MEINIDHINIGLEMEVHILLSCFAVNHNLIFYILFMVKLYKVKTLHIPCIMCAIICCETNNASSH